MRTLCFPRWRGALRLMWFWSAKLEVWSLMRNILRSLVGPFAWIMLKIFCCLAGLGEEGSIQQIAGPRGDDPSSNYPGPKRNGSYAIFEIKWGDAISRKSALHPARDTFLHKSHRTWRLWRVQGWLQQDLVFVLSAMKMQVSDMQSPENVLPLCSTNALCTRWLVLVMPTRWRTKGKAGQQFNCSLHAEPSTLHPMCIWSFWRNSLVRRLMWKRRSERRLRTLVTAVHCHFRSSGISMFKERSTDNFHDASVFENL